MNGSHPAAALMLLLCLGLTGCAGAAHACDIERLVSVSASEATSVNHLLSVAACLADADPAVRDEFAYARLTTLLRREDVPGPAIEALSLRLIERALSPQDAEWGVEAPFAILVLAEVARTDRVAPHFSDEARGRLVDVAEQYLLGLEDYRGFITGEGWRHGVAHAADLVMQLSLNDKLATTQGDRLLAAIATQVAPMSGHSYVFGEPGRLARAAAFLMVYERVSDAGVESFFDTLAPDDSPRWQDPYTHIEGLAALHNTRAFAHDLLARTRGNDDPRVQRVHDRAVALLGKLP